MADSIFGDCKVGHKTTFFCWKVFYFLALPGCYETSTLEVLIGSPQSSLGRFALALYSTTLRPQHKLGLLAKSQRSSAFRSLQKYLSHSSDLGDLLTDGKKISLEVLFNYDSILFVDILGFNLPREIVGGDMTVAKIIISSNDVNPLTFYDSIL